MSVPFAVDLTQTTNNPMQSTPQSKTSKRQSLKNNVKKELNTSPNTWKIPVPTTIAQQPKAKRGKGRPPKAKPTSMLVYAEVVSGVAGKTVKAGVAPVAFSVPTGERTSWFMEEIGLKTRVLECKMGLSIGGNAYIGILNKKGGKKENRIPARMDEYTWKYYAPKSDHIFVVINDPKCELLVDDANCQNSKAKNSSTKDTTEKEEAEVTSEPDTAGSKSLTQVMLELKTRKPYASMSEVTAFAKKMKSRKSLTFGDFNRKKADLPPVAKRKRKKRRRSCVSEEDSEDGLAHLLASALKKWKSKRSSKNGKPKKKRRKILRSSEQESSSESSSDSENLLESESDSS